MTGLEIVALTSVMVLGVTVVVTRSPLKQVFVVGVFGLSLVILFMVLQAPDVALSEVVVSTVAYPLIVLATIARTRERQDAQ